jgi:hypothetical protein
VRNLAHAFFSRRQNVRSTKLTNLMPDAPSTRTGYGHVSTALLTHAH